MKIALTISGRGPEAQLDLRFGRAAAFLVHDTESGAETIVDNTQNLTAAQGAGIQSAAHVVNAGAEVLITGHCGPKAFQVLKGENVRIYSAPAGPVSGALAAFKAGQLTEIHDADVESHW